MWLLALAVAYASAHWSRPRTNTHKQDDCTIDSIAHGLSMITHSRKAVDEDGRLCFVLFFLLYFIITNKNRLFHTLPFCEKQHSAALVYLLHPRSSAKPSSLHWSSSYQPFDRAVRTVGLTREAYAFAYALNCGHQLRLYICCTPDPQQSLRLFIGPVATSHLREQFVPWVQRAKLMHCVRA